jgi:phytoene synthase
MAAEPVPAAGDDPALTVRRRDRERWLSILWAPRAARAALTLIHAYDLELQRVVADAGETLLAEIRLAWWREQIDAIARGAAAPAQPLLRQIAADLPRRGVAPMHLSRMEEGFLPLLLAGDLDMAAAARDRGAPLFEALAQAEAGASLTPSARVAVRAAGEIWGMGALVRGPWGARTAVVAAGLLPEPPARPPFDGLSPGLAGLAALGWRDWKLAHSGRPLPPRATFGRQWAFLRVAIRH